MTFRLRKVVDDAIMELAADIVTGIPRTRATQALAPFPGRHPSLSRPVRPPVPPQLLWPYVAPMPVHRAMPLAWWRSRQPGSHARRYGQPCEWR